jgi:hypothetical protein
MRPAQGPEKIVAIVRSTVPDRTNRLIGSVSFAGFARGSMRHRGRVEVRSLAYGMRVTKSALTLQPMPRLFLKANLNEHDVTIACHASLLVVSIALRTQGDDRRA